MNERDLDILVAEKVLEWKFELRKADGIRWWDGCAGWPQLPRFTLDLEADHTVLRHVRAKWDSELRRLFRHKFNLICKARILGRPGSVDLGEHLFDEYCPGDYSRAALAVLGIEVDHD